MTQPVVIDLMAALKSSLANVERHDQIVRTFIACGQPLELAALMEQFEREAGQSGEVSRFVAAAKKYGAELGGLPPEEVRK